MLTKKLPRIPIGYDHFGEIIREGLLFVDKTLLIRHILNQSAKVTLITRPRRWGKTLNMSMLQHFFAAEVDGQLTQALFNGLAIAKDKTLMAHQGQYPVILVTFKGIKGSTYEEIFEQFKIIVSELFIEHEGLLSSNKLKEGDKTTFKKYCGKTINKAELENSLKFLSRCLKQHYRKNVYILIDEYDSPLNHLFNFPETKTTDDSENKSDFKRVSDVMSALLTACLKGNPHLEKGIMTGILRVAKANMFSKLNNVDENTLLDNTYAPYFGFTEAEVKALFIQQGLKDKFSEPKRWYNGYRLGKHVLYNPWSIMNCLMKKGVLRPYWVNTSEDKLIKTLATRLLPRIHADLEKLIKGEKINVDIERHVTFSGLNNNVTAFWSLLVSAGYLTIDSQDYDEVFGVDRCKIRIPNQEVKTVFSRIMAGWLSQEISVDEYRRFIDQLVKGNVEAFTGCIADYLMEFASVHDMARKPLESFYHGFILAIIAGVTRTHYVRSNRESGKGRFDIMILPKSKNDRQGMILEFKAIKDYNDIKASALEAVQQITNKRYDEDVKQYTHVERILKVGMAFCGKHVTSACQTKDMQTQKESKIAYTTTFSSSSESLSGSESEEKKTTPTLKQPKHDIKKSIAVLTKKRKRKREEKTQQELGSKFGEQGKKNEKEEGMTSKSKRVKTSEEKPSSEHLSLNK